MSILISLQTDLLATHPAISAESQLTSDEILVVSHTSDAAPRLESVSKSTQYEVSTGVACVISRIADAPYSYAEFILASDVKQIAIENINGRLWRTQWDFFAEFLEKGVIRSARLFGGLLHRESDVEIATNCCQAILQASPPLTT